jgi:hypothetical protein
VQYRVIGVHPTFLTVASKVGIKKPAQKNTHAKNPKNALKTCF